MNCAFFYFLFTLINFFQSLALNSSKPSDRLTCFEKLPGF